MREIVRMSANLYFDLNLDEDKLFNKKYVDECIHSIRRKLEDYLKNDSASVSKNISFTNIASTETVHAYFNIDIPSYESWVLNVDYVVLGGTIKSASKDLKSIIDILRWFNYVNTNIPMSSWIIKEDTSKIALIKAFDFPEKEVLLK